MNKFPKNAYKVELDQLFLEAFCLNMSTSTETAFNLHQRK